ncbi:MAG: hypothetical protein ACRD1P_02285 [Thermoanaerobaculia bacterium]
MKSFPAAVLLFSLAASASASAAAAEAAPTFCVEWVRQSREGYDRLTLFADRTLVWKKNRDGVVNVQRQTLAPEEFAFYRNYLARPELWALREDLRTGLTAEFAAQSLITLTRSDGQRKEIRFDELSALPEEAGALRSTLEGLRSVLTSPLAPASRFTPETLAPGTLLKRFDGVVFRVRRIEKEKDIVELEGVHEPYREFKKIGELRFQFSPPE